MERIKENVAIIKENEKIREFFKYSILIAHVCLLMNMVLNLGYAWEAVYQVFKDYYLGIAVFHFLISLAILQRIKIFNVVNILFVIVFSFIAHKNMTLLVEMPDLYNAGVVKWMCGGMMCVLLIDMIMYKKIAIIRERKLIGSILYVIAAAIAFWGSGGLHYSYLLCFPTICLFLLRINKDKLKKWLMCLTVGYYGAFLYTMIKSFIMVPYTGERYYGIYINHGFFGIFIGGAFVCTLWWLILLNKGREPVWKKCVVIALMIFSIVCSMMNGARVAEFAIMVVAFIAICIWGGEPQKKQIIYRMLISIVAVCILVVVALAGLYILNSYDEEALELAINNDILREKILYWYSRAQTMFKADSKFGIFASGSIINAIDRFSSGRFSHWVTYLRAAEFSPETNFTIVVNDYAMPHPHNAYIYWLYGLGIVPGIMLIIWIFSYLIQAAIQIFRKNDIYILSFLWVVYFMTAGINESVNWVVPVGFITLLLYYPLTMKYDELEAVGKSEK